MNKSLFRDKNNPAGPLKYYYKDVLASYSQTNSPNCLAHLGSHIMDLATDDATAETLIATNVVQLRAVKIRLCFELTDNVSAQQRTIPLRIDNIQEDQSTPSGILQRYQPPFYLNNYLRPNVGDTDHVRDITSALDAPISVS